MATPVIDSIKENNKFQKDFLISDALSHLKQKDRILIAKFLKKEYREGFLNGFKMRMNVKIIVCILLMTISSFSQNQLRINTTEFQQFSVVIDPYASYKEKGLHIGIEIENVRNLYERFSITNFSALKNGYTDFIGSFGLNFTRGMYEKTRLYSGIRLGIISRNGTHPLFGYELGIDTKIFENVVIGLRIWRDYRSDMEFNDGVNQWRNNGGGRIGFTF